MANSHFYRRAMYAKIPNQHQHISKTAPAHYLHSTQTSETYAVYAANGAPPVLTKLLKFRNPPTTHAVPHDAALFLEADVRSVGLGKEILLWSLGLGGSTHVYQNGLDTIEVFIERV
ncbi:1836_t:CDS:2 [Paraglomus brasilianum]|uniref:1836_t:CDS:1 n=1 Tax=Paraglomus brasilianum TaxID=144538 RepID=A0A9N9DLL6_9GLOM|nr:1836_t:CDS:2 [Paraglomus brasilianum]